MASLADPLRFMVEALLGEMLYEPRDSLTQVKSRTGLDLAEYPSEAAR
jgi:hypothetical protein